MFAQLIDLFLHIDVRLESILNAYGALTYAILFLIVLCETGLVVTPFLPGDSLLFAAGAFAAKGMMDITILFILLSVAAILGDSLNFSIGKKFGAAIENRNSRLIKREYIGRTRAFYARHGGKTIVFARFMPIIRTFAPFVAGVGKMNYFKFISYNVFGGLLWVILFLGAGYFFGSIPFVEKNFTIVILVIIFVSILPGVVGWIRSLVRSRDIVSR